MYLQASFALGNQFDKVIRTSLKSIVNHLKCRLFTKRTYPINLLVYSSVVPLVNQSLYSSVGYPVNCNKWSPIKLTGFALLLLDIVWHREWDSFVEQTLGPLKCQGHKSWMLLIFRALVKYYERNLASTLLAFSYH